MLWFSKDAAAAELSTNLKIIMPKLKLFPFFREIEKAKG